MSVCQGCDAQLAPESARTGRPRKWCSENCRKRAWDRENGPPCNDCGKPLNAKNARRGGGERCRACDNARRQAEHEAKLDLIEGLYNAGASHRQIALALGWPESSQPNMYLRELRQQGRIGYRNRGYGQVAA